MKALRVALVSVVFCVLLVAFCGKAFATTESVSGSHISVGYTKFNSTSWYCFDLGKNYSSLTVDCVQYLAWNGTGEHTIEIKFANYVVPPETLHGILFQVRNTDKRLCVYFVDGTDLILLATGSAEAMPFGNTTRIVFHDGQVDVYALYGTASEVQLVSGFGFPYDVQFITVSGQDTKCVTGGYATFDLNVSMGSTIMEWVPTLLSFAMLGMVLGLIKRTGR